jgi:hypothetical protein
MPGNTNSMTCMLDEKNSSLSWSGRRKRMEVAYAISGELRDSTIRQSNAIEQIMSIEQRIKKK